MQRDIQVSISIINNTTNFVINLLYSTLCFLIYQLFIFCIASNFVEHHVNFLNDFIKHAKFQSTYIHFYQ